MEWLTEFIEGAGSVLLVVIETLICIAAVILSCISISGTWLIVIVAAIMMFTSKSGFPGIWTIALFVIVSVLVEIFESVAGYYGVTKKGGSKLAGFAALAGGMIGIFIGGIIIPVPVAGSLAGMLILSFLPAYFIEKKRLQNHDKAKEIALGSVFSRIAVILGKLCVTLAMILWLVLGHVFN